MASVSSSLSSASLWFQVSRKHLDQKQKEHQANDAEDDDEDDDRDGHEHVNPGTKVADAVLHLLVLLVAATVDLAVTKELSLDALWLFCAWTPPIVVVVGRTVLLEWGDHQFQLLVRLPLS